MYRSAPRPVDCARRCPSPGVTTYKRRPIVPSWLTSKPGFVATVQRATGNALYATAYHGIRTPWYALQLGMLAAARHGPPGARDEPVGVGRRGRPAARL